MTRQGDPIDTESVEILRPTGGTKKFRRNCRLVSEPGSIVVTDRRGKTTRYLQDGTENAPAQMVSYLYREPFTVVDGRGRGLITSDDVLWDDDEQAEFCKAARIDFIAVVDAPPQLRPDGVRLEEPAWLRGYTTAVPYVLVAAALLAVFGRAFNLSLWLTLFFLPWLLMYPVVRQIGYFTPRRIGPATIRAQREAAEHSKKNERERLRDGVRKGRSRKS